MAAKLHWTLCETLDVVRVGHRHYGSSKVVTCLWLVLLLKCPQICPIRRHPQKICTTTPGYFLTYLSREVSISVPASYLHLLLYLELCPIKIGREFPARNVRKKKFFLSMFCFCGDVGNLVICNWCTYYLVVS